MENIINKIFELHLNTETFPLGTPDKKALTEEWNLYEYLHENLSSDQKTKFLSYINLINLRQAQETKYAYEQGFKTAMKLIFEAYKD